MLTLRTSGAEFLLGPGLLLLWQLATTIPSPENKKKPL
jgi:hypothetical protein